MLRKRRKPYSTYKDKSFNLIAGLAVVLLFAFTALAGTMEYSTVQQESRSPYELCSEYYTIPCDNNGEVRTDLTTTEISKLYIENAQGIIHLSEFELKYLHGLDGGQN